MLAKLMPMRLASTINWAFNNKQEMIDIIEVVYRGARKGRGLVLYKHTPKAAFLHAWSALVETASSRQAAAARAS
eukprot:13502-Heterococcus_DN1.PRE.8